METRTVSVRGGQFHIPVLEGGSGAAVLFLHGTNGLQPDRFLNLLSDRFHVIAPTHPGFGEATGSQHLLDLWDLLIYYLDFLDQEGLRNLPVVAHSLGAMVALELAALQPERFTRLALIAPLGLWNPEHPVADIFAMTPSELAALTYCDPHSEIARAAAQVPHEPDAFVQYMLERAKAMSTSAKYLFPIPNRGLHKRLHRVRVPVQLVWGECDRIVPPAYAEDFRRYLPQAEVAVLPRAGYLPQEEQPEALAETVTAFLVHQSSKQLTPAEMETSS
jgi:pimeloyl-ACP methyl ester carboxylesterase